MFTSVNLAQKDDICNQIDHHFTPFYQPFSMLEFELAGDVIFHFLTYGVLAVIGFPFYIDAFSEILPDE